MKIGFIEINNGIIKLTSIDAMFITKQSNTTYVGPWFNKEKIVTSKDVYNLIVNGNPMCIDDWETYNSIEQAYKELYRI